LKIFETLDFQSYSIFSILNIPIQSYYKTQLLEINACLSHLQIENILDRENIVNRGGGTSENLGYKSPDLSIYLGIKFTN